MRTNNINIDDVIKTTLSVMDLSVPNRDVVLANIVDVYLSTPLADETSLEQIGNDLLKFTQATMAFHNANLDKSQSALKWSIPKHLESLQLAMCLLKKHGAVKIKRGNTDKFDIALKYDGEYTYDKNIINGLILQYNIGSTRAYITSVLSRVEMMAPVAALEDLNEPKN